MPEWEIKLSPSLQEMPFDSRARHNSCTAWHGTVNLEWSAWLRFTIRWSWTMSCHIDMVLLSSILSLILFFPLFSSSQLKCLFSELRRRQFVRPSAITNLSLAARLGWLRPKRSGPSPVSHCTTLPSVSDQLGVCATCLYCPLLPGQKCQWIAQRVCCTNQAHDRKSGAVLNRLYFLGRVTHG